MRRNWKPIAVATCLLAQCLSSTQAFAGLGGLRSAPSPLRQPSISDIRSPECIVRRASKNDSNQERLEMLRESYGEQSRKFRRSFFQHDDWLKHRAYDRFWKNLRTIVESGLVREVAGEVGAVFAIASFVWAWNTFLVTGFVDLNGVEYYPMAPDLPLMVLPNAAFSFSSPALALLLVFRTNVAYQRWDEARKAWGVIVNHSRNLLRQGASWVTEETEPDFARRHDALKFFCDSVWAFSRSMQRHLWGFHEDDENFKRDVRERLPQHEAEGLIVARHKPTRANHDLSRAIDQLPVTYLRRLEIDKSAIEFANAMGACDRIFSSPVPLFYTRHTARFLGAWILALPLALYDPYANSWNHIGMIPAATIVSFFFFGIEELSVALEEPFSILPLDKITGGIGLSAEEHFAWHFEEGKSQLVRPTESMFITDQAGQNLYVTEKRFLE